MKNRKIALALILLLIVVLIGWTLRRSGNDDKTDRNAEDSSSITEQSEEGEEAGEESEEQVKEGLALPYELDGGKLTVNSLFQSSITNPDGGGEMVDDLAALEFENQSEEYLKQAEIEVVLTDGTEFSFKVEGLPAGETATLFDVNNTVLDAKQDELSIQTISCDPTYGEQNLMEDQVAISVDENQITIKNQTDEDLNGLTLSCHALFDDRCFGGILYEYPVDSIPAGEDVVVEAAECYLDSVEVVNITE